jgi:IS30 family transposase
MLAKIEKKDAEIVAAALVKHAQRLPTELYQSLTWDRGTEMANHRPVYFCDPKSSWQRGSNENTNRLLRQYLPKGTDLSIYTQAQLNNVARQLNERPRKTLDYETPAEKFQACVAATS